MPMLRARLAVSDLPAARDTTPTLTGWLEGGRDVATGWLPTGCCDAGSGSRCVRSPGGGSAMMRGDEASDPALEGMRELGGATRCGRVPCQGVLRPGAAAGVAAEQGSCCSSGRLAGLRGLLSCDAGGSGVVLRVGA